MNRKFSFLAPFLILLISIIFLGGLLWGNITFARSFSGEKNFLIPWLSAQTFLRFGEPDSPDRVTPYSVSTSQRAQINYYGRIANDNEDPLILWIPLTAELFYFPFSLITNYEIAVGLWRTITELSLIVASFLLLRLLNWRPAKSIRPMIVAISALWGFGIITILSASATPLILLACIGALLFLRSEQDEMAGVLLAFCVLQPGIFLLFIFFIILIMSYQRRWKVLAGFGMTQGILLLISFIVLPGWIMPFIRGLFWHLQFNSGLSTYKILSSSFPVAGPRFALLMSILSCLLFFYELWNARNGGFRHILWVSCHAITIAPLAGLPISPFEYVALIIPLLMFIYIASDRWVESQRRLRTIIILGSFLIIGWLLVLFNDGILVMPLLIIALLYWVRWWAIRPPQAIVEYLK